MPIDEISKKNLFYILDKELLGCKEIHLGLTSEKYYLNFIIFKNGHKYSMFTFKKDLCELFYHSIASLEEEVNIHKYSHKCYTFKSSEDCKKFLKNYILVEKLKS